MVGCGNHAAACVGEREHGSVAGTRQDDRVAELVRGCYAAGAESSSISSGPSIAVRCRRPARRYDDSLSGRRARCRCDGSSTA